MPIESVRNYKLPDPIPIEEQSYENAARGDEEETAEEAEAELLGRLLTWLQGERDRQSENRLQMAIDHDYYDGDQISDSEAAKLEERGQAPLVFNEVKVGLDWITGAERRDRTDWRVLPREESDGKMAEIKTDVLKFVSDTNDLPFIRSQAFTEAAIAGLSFLEDSLNSDATSDILYAGHESWRNCLHDSYDPSLTGKGWRYFFRWRILDLDVAKHAFSNRNEELEEASAGADQLFYDEQEELWYLGERLTDRSRYAPFRRTAITQMVSDIYNRRERVKVYECWYREPMEAQVLRGGPYHGEVYDETHQGQGGSVDRGEADIVPSWIMRVHVCYFTERHILSKGASPFKHNDFPFTPIYCFRRGRDGMPYGFVRNVRDPQDDLNKRMSKSLFLISVNQLITEKSAFDSEGEYTLQHAIDNASNPNGVFIMADGSKKFELRRDYAEEQAQMMHVGLDRQFIQSGQGVTDELLGRKTNAISGRAVEARQNQGTQVTSGIFDHYRLAKQLSGQKQLSNIETFYTMPKVLRLIGQRKAQGLIQLPGVSEQPQDGTDPQGIKWVKINQPEVQADGSVRWLNDITATRADYIVDEQDFRATMRMAMFDQLSDMLGKIASAEPRFALGMIDLVVDVADFPGKEEFVARLRQLQKMLLNPEKPPEQQALEKKVQELQVMLAEAKVDRERSAADKDQAAVTKTLADADKADAEADTIRASIPFQAQAIDLKRVAQDDARAQAAAAGAREMAQHQDKTALAAKTQEDSTALQLRSQDQAAQQHQDSMQLSRKQADQAAAQDAGGGKPAAGTKPSAPAPQSELVSPGGAPGAAGQPAVDRLAEMMAQFIQAQDAQNKKVNQALMGVADAIDTMGSALEELSANRGDAGDDSAAQQASPSP